MTVSERFLVTTQQGGTVGLSAHECGNCGVVYALSEGYEAARRQDHATWYCPNGHHWHFPGESEEERLKRLLSSEKDRRARVQADLDRTEASRRAWKGQTTKLRKQVLAGQCPLCGQHLRDLERHIARVHPGEQAETSEP